MKKRGLFLALIAILFCTHSVLAEFYPEEHGGKWGYYTEADGVLLEAQFDYAAEFSDGRAVVAVNGLFGYVDEGGFIVLEPQFYAASDFDKGEALVAKAAVSDKQRLSELNLSYIDRDGNFLRSYLDNFQKSAGYTQPKPGETLYCLALSDLNLRESSSAEARKIMAIPSGQSVTVLADPKPQVSQEIGGVVGKWLFVEYAGKKGYVFDGFLSKLPAPDFTDEISLEAYFTSQDEVEFKSLKLSARESVDVHILKSKAVMEQYYVSGTDAVTTICYFPNITKQEALQIVKLIYGELYAKSVNGTATIGVKLKDVTIPKNAEELVVELPGLGSGAFLKIAPSSDNYIALTLTRGFIPKTEDILTLNAHLPLQQNPNFVEEANGLRYAFSLQTVPMSELVAPEKVIALDNFVLYDANKDKVLDTLLKTPKGPVVVDGRTGEVLWQEEIADCSSFVRFEDKVFFVGKGGLHFLYQIRLDSLLPSSKIPLGQLPDGPCDSPVLDGDRLSVKTFDGSFLIINPRNFSPAEAAQSTENFKKRFYYSYKSDSDGNRYLYAEDMNNKFNTWQFNLETLDKVEYTLVNDRIYLLHPMGNFFVLDAYSGSVAAKDRVELKNWQVTKPFVYDGKVYLWTGSELITFDALKNKRLWKIPVLDVVGTPYLYNGVFYFQTSNNYIYAISASEGKLLWTLKIHQGLKGPFGLVEEDGALCIVTADGKLFTVEISELKLAEFTAEDEYIEMGMVLAEQSYLRTAPNRLAKAIQKVGFGTPLCVLKTEEIKEVKGTSLWCKVQLDDSKNFGWIPAKEIGSIAYYRRGLETGDGSSLLYNIAQYGEVSDEMLEKVLNYLLTNFPDNREIEVESPVEEGTYWENIKIGVLNRFARMYSEKNDFLKEIEYYQKIITYPVAKKNDQAWAYYNMLSTYAYRLKDSEKAAAVAHKIITDFPNEEIVTYEWNEWVDIYAAWTLLDIYSQGKFNFEKLGVECKKILGETTNPPVVVLAASGVLTAFINAGDFESAEKYLLTILETNSESIRCYYTSEVNFSLFPISFVAEAIVKKYGDYNRAASFLLGIKAKTKNSKIHELIQYKCALLWDKGNGSRKWVLDNYKLIPERYWWDPIENTEMAYVVDNRVSEIETEPGEEGTLLGNDVPIKDGLESKVTMLSLMFGQAKVKIEYRDNRVVRFGDKVGSWVKVSLRDGRICWVFDSYLDREKHVPLITSKDATPRPLKKPGIILKLPDFRNNQVVTTDINGDEYADLLGYVDSGLVAFDGVTQKYLWLHECENGSVPLVKDDRIYLQAVVEDKEYLLVLEKKTGKTIWNLALSKENFGATSTPVVGSGLIFVNTLKSEILAIDGQSRTVKWRYSALETLTRSLSFADNMVYFTRRDGTNNLYELIALDAFSGKLVWRFTSEKYENPTFSIEKNLVVCNAGDGNIYALDTKTGKVIWKNDLVLPTELSKIHVWFKPVISKNMVYCHTELDKVFAFELTTGKNIWVYQDEFSLANFSRVLTVIDGAIYLCGEQTGEDYLYAISPGYGKLLWQVSLGKEEIGTPTALTIVQEKILIPVYSGLFIIGEI